MKKWLVIGLCLSASINIFAQDVHYFKIPLAGTSLQGTGKEDWNPTLQNLEMPSVNPGSERWHIKHLKDSLAQLYCKADHRFIGNESSRMTAAPAPYLNRNFQGNTYNYSVPNDNDVAVSNSGKMISVQNTTLFKYDLNSNTATGTQSLSAFSSVLKNPNVCFDPKVIYDPGTDRFICCFLQGLSDSTSSATLAFSQTGDPAGAWNFYSLPGNPLQNHLFTDFPMIAVSDKELFLTVNLIQDNMTWQAGWVQTVIWQINKQSGFTGGTLQTALHTGIQLGGRGIRNLCPVKGGSQVYGPGMYFLSDRNLDARNDSIFLVHVNDTIGAAGLVVTETVLEANTSYYFPVNALQPGPSLTQQLATNDSRVLGAFIENQEIQFVCNTLDTTHGKTGIYYGHITQPATAPVLTASILGDTAVYTGYPNISYAGKGTGDQSAIISYDYSAATVDPGMAAVATDGTGNFSSPLIVKNGLGFMSILSSVQRWGDYSGSQRKYDEPGVVWVNGLYGASTHRNSTWIAELSFSPAGINSLNQSLSPEVSLFPNPTAAMLTVSFTLPATEYLSFEIFNAEGRLVQLLLRDKVKAGKNEFSFNTAALPAGTYILRIGYGEKEAYSKRFIKSSQ